jgi:hypothetical protein
LGKVPKCHGSPLSPGSSHIALAIIVPSAVGDSLSARRVGRFGNGNVMEMMETTAI